MALSAAASDKVVTIGLAPNRPETGFGYLECERPTGLQPVRRFVEKPDLATAKQYLESGTYLWNSGMFFFSARRLLAEIDHHLPALGKLLTEIGQAPDRASALYPLAPSTSIDYGVMEKLEAGTVFVVPAEFGWNDVGSWSALFDIAPHGTGGNVNPDAHVVVDSARNVLYANGKQIIAAVGVSDLVIVATEDAVLVMPRDRAQDVRHVVSALKEKQRDDLL